MANPFHGLPDGQYIAVVFKTAVGSENFVGVFKQVLADCAVCIKHGPKFSSEVRVPLDEVREVMVLREDIYDAIQYENDWPGSRNAWTEKMTRMVRARKGGSNIVLIDGGEIPSVAAYQQTVTHEGKIN